MEKTLVNNSLGEAAAVAEAEEALTEVSSR